MTPDDIQVGDKLVHKGYPTMVYVVVWKDRHEIVAQRRDRIVLVCPDHWEKVGRIESIERSGYTLLEMLIVLTIILLVIASVAFIAGASRL